MTTHFLKLRPGQLSGRFAGLVILFSSLIALLITGAELGYEYARDLRQIDGRMAQIQDAYLESVTENLWVADRERLDTLLQGIIRLPDFVLAEIRVDGRIEISHGHAPAGEGVTQVFTLQRLHQGRLQVIGELTVQASYDGALQRMLERALVILLANGLKTLLVALFIVVIFYRLIGQHVERISLYAHVHDGPDEAPDLVLERAEPKRPDELTELVAAINHLRRQLLQHVQRESQRAQTLDQLVTLRTTEIMGKKEELRQARDEAEWASRAKSHFLAAMSHELRTPLNVILGFARLLETSSSLNEADRESVRFIIDGGEDLLALVDNVIQLTAGESMALDDDLTPVTVVAVLREREGEWARQLAKHGMGWRLETGSLGEVRVRAQASRLQQALSNYISNAIKYGQKAGLVRMTAERHGDRVRISVRNEGAGISAQRLQELFMPFSRLGRAGSDILGAGLGLSVTREMIEAMGGQVGVSSEEGQGATFWVELPVSAP